MGQLATDPQLVTTGAAPLTDVTALTVGYFHACARVGTSEVYCWGNNNRNQVGPDAEIKSAVAVKVALPAGVVGAISAGGEHSCANVTTSDGRRSYCWGRTGNGRLGNLILDEGASTTPQLVVQDIAETPLPDAVAIAAGNRHTCAIKAPFDEVFCWGNNEHGEVGDNSTVSVGFASLIIKNGEGEAHAIGTGDAHTCAAVDDTVRCWGIDADGEIGDGDDNGANELVPVQTATLASRQIGLTTGHTHNCSLGLDRVVHCWGLNDHGELGNGDTVPRTSPTPLSPLAFCPRAD
jgi:alpha-tubulin suppressor-like RCC1 family protein